MRLYGTLSELSSLTIRLASGDTVQVVAAEQSHASGAVSVTIPDLGTTITSDEMILATVSQTMSSKTINSSTLNTVNIASSTSIKLPLVNNPQALNQGVIAWDSTGNRLVVGGSNSPTGLTDKVFVDENSSQTLTNKTLTAPTISGGSASNQTLTNAAINSATRIALGSLTTGVGNGHVLISDGSGDLDSEAVLAKSRGGAGADMTNVVFPATGTLVTEAGSQTLSNKTIGTVTAESGLLTVSGTGALRLPLGNATTNRPTGTAAQLKGMIRYNDTDDAFEGYNELSGWSSLGGGGTTDRVTQASHGFVIGDVLYMNGSVYAKALADAANTAEVVGMVSRIIDASTFELTLSGEVAGLSGLTPGENYFLSAATAGAITATEPSVVGQVSLPIGVASSATSLYVAPKRGVVVGGANLRTQIGLNGDPLLVRTTNIQNVTAYTAGELSGWVYIDATTDRRFYIQVQFVKDAANAWKASYQTTGDTPPAGFNVDVVVVGADAFVQVQMPAVAGWVSGSVNFALNAPAVGATLPLQIASGLITPDGSAFSVNGWNSGSVSVIMSSTSPTVQRIVSPASAVSVTLPSTGIKAGYQMRLIASGCSEANHVKLLSSSGSEIERLTGVGFIEVTAIVDSPTSSSDWVIVNYRNAGVLSFSDVTFSAIGGGSWSVDSGDFSQFSYIQTPGLLTLNYQCGPFTITGAVTDLVTTLPTRFKQFLSNQTNGITYNNTGSAFENGLVSTNTGSRAIAVTRNGGSLWTAGANLSYFRLCVVLSTN